MDGLKRLVTILVLLFVVVGVSASALAQSSDGARQAQQGQAGQGGMQQTNKNLADTISNMPKISMFDAAIKAGGYDDMLSGQGTYIVFAPTDDSIQRDYGISDVSSLNNDQIDNIVQNCIASPGQQGQQQANSGQLTLTTLGGKTITATKSNGKITVNGVHVVYATKATNGMLVITDGLVSGAPGSAGTSGTTGTGSTADTSGYAGMGGTQGM
jgi:uncharacterized surface protein with fasciclin (FAS1) repeats